MSTVSVELESAVELTEENKHKFDLYAIALGVEVGQRGRKPKAALVRAIQASDQFTLVDTDYLNAAMADTAQSGSEYGKRKRALLDAREDAFEAARSEYETALKTLRAEYGLTTSESVSSAPSGGNVVVSAITPQLDRDGNVKRNKAGDKVLFRPAPREVTLTAQQIRELAPDAGTRGRLSKAHTIHAAVVAGKWFPVEHMDTEGWESVLLKDVTVSAVATEENAA